VSELDHRKRLFNSRDVLQPVSFCRKNNTARHYDFQCIFYLSFINLNTTFTCAPSVMPILGKPARLQI
jgi:hypothetical protein